MKIVTVIPFKKGVWKEDLTYFTSKDIPYGSIVSIQLRNKNILGLVINSEEVKNEKRNIKDLPFNLKKIIETKEQAIFRPEFLDSILETCKYFIIKKNDGATVLIPSAFKEGYDQIANFNNATLNYKNQNKEILKNIKNEKLLFQAPLIDRISYYKTLIRGSFALKKSVFIVLPNKHEIETFLEPLAKGIENFVFSIHGELTTKNQLEKFKEITSSTHPILILGTAPYLSIPRFDLETIILEEENTNSYKMIGKPHFDLRTFVEVFASKIGAKFILADSFLRFETIARKETENLNEVYPLSFHLNFKGEIEIPENEINPLAEKVKFKTISDNSLKEIEKSILKKENIFVFSLRKGLATITICRDCNSPIICKKCSAPVVLYLSKDNQKRMYICNKCGTERSPETICENCGSWNLMPLGIGTDTVFEEIKQNFPKTQIFQLDKESAKTEKGAEKIANEFEKIEGGILVGTEMALSYLKKSVPLSVIASFDSLWSIPNFKMSEKIIQIITSILVKTENKLIIQTKNEKDEVIQAIKNENLLSFVRNELNDRKSLGYPPYQRFIKIVHIGDKEDTLASKEYIQEIFKEYNPDIFSGFVSKIKNKYITNTLIKINPQDWSLTELISNSKINADLSAKLSSLPPDFEIFIDPEDLL